MKSCWPARRFVCFRWLRVMGGRSAMASLARSIGKCVSLVPRMSAWTSPSRSVELRQDVVDGIGEYLSRPELSCFDRIGPLLLVGGVGAWLHLWRHAASRFAPSAGGEIDDERG